MSGFDKRKLVHGLRNNDVIVPELIMLAEYYSGIAGAVNFFKAAYRPVHSKLKHFRSDICVLSISFRKKEHADLCVMKNAFQIFSLKRNAECMTE